MGAWFEGTVINVTKTEVKKVEPMEQENSENIDPNHQSKDNPESSKPAITETCVYHVKFDEYVFNFSPILW